MSTSAEHAIDRHELNAKWKMWYDYQDKKYIAMENWSESLQEIGTVPDVETFWGIQEEIGEIEKLPVSSNMHFFRDGIQPMWEDEKNSEGGKWVLEVGSEQKTEAIWVNTLLFCISEIVLMKTLQKTERNELVVNSATVDKSLQDAICGAVLSPRKNYIRISLWTKIKDDRVLRIGKLWKEFAEIPDAVKIIFKAHESSSRGGGQDIYTI